MLEASVVDLAKAASDMQMRESTAELMTAIATQQELFAHHGIVGGAAIPKLASLFGDYWVARYKAVGNALLRACRSAGVGYSHDLVADLTSALDTIVEADKGDFAPFLSHHLQPHIGGQQMADGIASSTVNIARKNGRDAAIVDFGHFAAELKTARTSVAGDHRFEIAKLLAAAVIGAAVQWLVEHGGAMAAEVWRAMSHHA